jgi:hypothetical protein
MMTKKIDDNYQVLRCDSWTLSFFNTKTFLKTPPLLVAPIHSLTQSSHRFNSICTFFPFLPHHFLSASAHIICLLKQFIRFSSRHKKGRKEFSLHSSKVHHRWTAKSKSGDFNLYVFQQFSPLSGNLENFTRIVRGGIEMGGKVCRRFSRKKARETRLTSNVRGLRTL